MARRPASRSRDGHAFQHFHDNIRQPLIDYAHKGILPTDHPWLMHALAGDYAQAVELLNESCPGFDYLVEEVISAVEASCGDIAHGSKAYVLRWSDWGGLDNRPAQYP